MQHIEPSSLSTLPAHIAYLKSFLNFTEDDAESLHAVKDLLAPLLPEILDSAYAKLLSFDITATSFLPRGTNYQGATASKIEDLHLTHPQIIFRKHFLQKYLLTLVSSDYDDMKTWEYLEKIAIMHTGKPGFAYRQNKPELRVEYMHMAMHLGYIMDVVMGAIMEHPELDDSAKCSVLRAFNKVIWIQNDLFAHHYMPDPYAEGSTKTSSRGKAPISSPATCPYSGSMGERQAIKSGFVSR